MQSYSLQRNEQINFNQMVKFFVPIDKNVVWIAEPGSWKGEALFFPAGAAVQFVFKKAAIDLAGIKLDAAAGFEADLFGQFQVASRDISEIALTFLIE